jgi:hypothetical protein
MRVESDEARRHLYFHWSVNITGNPTCSALFLKLIFKNNKFLYLYYRMLTDTTNKNFGNESYFKFSYRSFNYSGESPNSTPNKD